MGMSLSVDLGVGVVVPVSDGAIVDTLVTETDADDDFELYDFFEEMNSKYPLLNFEYGYSEDYITGAAIFVKRLQSYGYYEVASLPFNHERLTDEEQQQLGQACVELKIPLEVKYLALPSYG